jgi:hypothetical protein
VSPLAITIFVREERWRRDYRRLIVQLLVPAAQNTASLTFVQQARGGAANSLSPRTTMMHMNSIAHGSDDNFHEAAVRVGAEVTTGFASAWTAGSIGQGVGMLLGALAGTLVCPSIGTISGESIGGAAGELVGVAAGAVFGVDLGATVARDIIA